MLRASLCHVCAGRGPRAYANILTCEIGASQTPPLEHSRRTLRQVEAGDEPAVAPTFAELEGTEGLGEATERRTGGMTDPLRPRPFFTHGFLFNV